MRQFTNAKVSALPVDKKTINAVIAQTIEPKILSFPVRIEMYRSDEAQVQVECDHFLGMCDGCGSATYSSESPRLVDGVIACPVCVAEELNWRKVVVPEVYEVAA
jgi:hypothetical protein